MSSTKFSLNAEPNSAIWFYLEKDDKMDGQKMDPLSNCKNFFVFTSFFKNVFFLYDMVFLTCFLFQVKTFFLNLPKN